MNQSNIDYLYQILPPGGERPTQPTRSDHGGFGFGEHLSQASASVFEVPPPAKREPSRPGESTKNIAKTWHREASLGSDS